MGLAYLLVWRDGSSRVVCVWHVIPPVLLVIRLPDSTVASVTPRACCVRESVSQTVEEASTQRLSLASLAIVPVQNVQGLRLATVRCARVEPISMLALVSPLAQVDIIPENGCVRCVWNTVRSAEWVNACGARMDSGCRMDAAWTSACLGTTKALTTLASVVIVHVEPVMDQEFYHAPPAHTTC
ncbi:uncharacterized protein LOC125045399 [Penaeus chinensis]|uniref:uncharacterized protein LOC125045399 n=1 Tax=Penaeus chinensis TaxID=139456 RepID=UPI001FB6C8B7|nr:uncharacterized protein LOC125045399 [Penaeus chinensis]